MGQLTDRSGRPSSGTVQSTVVGIVTDNVDPEELGRIKVKYPTLPGEPESHWLRQVAPMGGQERGLYALPEVNDEVLVMFMQGSQDVGVIVGQFWNGVDKPPTEAKDGMPTPGDSGALERSTDEFTQGSTDLSANDRRFWRSRSGHLIAMDDTGGAETIQIWDKEHVLALVFDSVEQRILLTNSQGDIHIRTKNDLYLEAGNDMIVTAKNNFDLLVHNDMLVNVDMNMTFESGMESSWKAGMNFKVEATQNFEAKATMDAKIEGTMNFEAKGNIAATLQGSAQAVVKGGIVMIN